MRSSKAGRSSWTCVVTGRLEREREMNGKGRKEEKGFSLFYMCFILFVSFIEVTVLNFRFL